ncbi:MAG: oxygenase MpaB family protein [Saprospiraceae bacterium]
MNHFVEKNSIVRRIWGDSDTILLIFAGAAAEFALSKVADWLYFTGRLPADPLGRLFSTVAYARNIIFAGEQEALNTIDNIAAIHRGVEAKRGAAIPDWAYRDVLFMLIDYSIRSFEALERPLDMTEKKEVFGVFHRFGSRMGINGLPHTFEEWEKMRPEQLRQNMERSHYTEDLYRQYRKHLGPVRYRILLALQRQLVPPQVRELLGLGESRFLKPHMALYKLIKRLHADWAVKEVLFPPRYKAQFRALEGVG